MRGLRPAALSLAAVVTLSGTLSCASPPRIYHTVKGGENLFRIGLRYGVPATELMRANGIGDVSNVQIGTRLLIPEGSQRKAAPASAPKTPPGAGRPGYADTRRAVRGRVQSGADLVFQWPVEKGELVSRYGYRWGRRHEGIDIAAPRGTRIHAAESGRVIHAGGLGSYGQAVIVSHNAHYRTLYAHARGTKVRKGQRVNKGQLIAEVGTSGNSTGPHLHFEIRKGERPRDPLLFLP